MILTGENRSTGRKTCAIATLSTTNPTWTDMGSNPGLRGERLPTDRLSHDMAEAEVQIYIYIFVLNSYLAINTASQLQRRFLVTAIRKTFTVTLSAKRRAVRRYSYTALIAKQVSQWIRCL
jgi:hypothetical protein